MLSDVSGTQSLVTKTSPRLVKSHCSLQRRLNLALPKMTTVLVYMHFAVVVLMLSSEECLAMNSSGRISENSSLNGIILQSKCANTDSEKICLVSVLLASNTEE